MRTLCLLGAAVLTPATVAVAGAPRAAAGPVFVIRAWTSLECGGDKPNSTGACSQGADLWTQRWSDALGRPEINTGPNGLRKLDDPAIFSWELANEPRCINASLPTSGTCTADTLVSWATEMSRFIKSLDGNHMVSVGDEGFHPGVGGTEGSWPYNVTDGVDHARLTAIPTIDFGTYHLYPQGWGQSPAQDWGTGWINDHNTVGGMLNKPEILSGGGDGWNFWLLTGIQDDGQLYPYFDGFRVATPSATATVLSNAAVRMGGGGGGDVTPPTTPGTPTTSGVTATGATLSWAASTDAGLAGYTVYRRQGTADPPLTQSATNTVSLTGLAPSTQYTVVVRARDNAGNPSSASGPVTFTTLPGSGTCRVAYEATDWGGSNGFTANVTIG